MAYLISYDLRYPGRDYTRLTAEIGALGTCVKPLESVWIVDSTLDVQTIIARLNAVDMTDSLLVIRVNNPWWSIGLDQRIVTWMQQIVN
jgi:hypothetical protein